MARLNLSAIIDEVRTKVRDATLSGDQVALWANMAQDKIIRSMDAPWLEETASFETVADQRQYLLEGVAFSKVKSVINETHEEILQQVSEKYIDYADPSHEASGQPIAYCIYGLTKVENQLSEAAIVNVQSDSASDITQSVLVRGEDANGKKISESFNLNGTAWIVGTVTFTKILEVAKSENTVGSVTVLGDDPAVTQVVVIPPDKLSRQFQPVNLYPIPSGAFDIRVRYIREVRELVEEQDEPDLPEMWHDLVLMGTLVQAHEYLYEFEKAAEMKAMLDRELDSLRQQAVGNIRDNQRKIRPRSLKQSSPWRRKLPYPVG